MNAFATPGAAEALAVLALPPVVAFTTYAWWRWLLQDAKLHERARANRRARLRLKSTVAASQRYASAAGLTPDFRAS